MRNRSIYIGLLFFPLLGQSQQATGNFGYEYANNGNVNSGIYPFDSISYCFGGYVYADTMNGTVAFGGFITRNKPTGELDEFIPIDTDSNYFFSQCGVILNDTLAVISGQWNIYPIAPSGRLAVGLFDLRTGHPYWMVQSIVSDTPSTWQPRKIMRTSSGEFIISGWHQQSAPPHNTVSVFLQKVDSLGNQIWIKKYNSTTYHISGNSIEEDADGGYLLSAWEKPHPDNGMQYYRSRFFKLDTAGNVQWTYRSPVGPPYIGSTCGLQRTPDQHFVYGGTYLIYNNQIQDYWHQPFLEKISLSGEVIWTQPFGFKHTRATVAGLLQLNDGSLVVGGSNYEIESTYLYFPAYLRKFSAEGDSLWTRTYRILETVDTFTFEYHFMWDLKRANDGGFWISGEAQDLYPEPYQYAWIVKTDSFGCLIPGCQYVGLEEESPQADLQIYPNPASDYLYFMAGVNMPEATIRILNQQGQEVQYYNTEVTAEAQLICNVQGLAPGLYFLQLSNASGQTWSEKFIKQ